nr:DUF674 domain-containing protein [Ipomoea batatas]
MAAAFASTMSLKLLVDKNARKVIFAETDKPFVDFLFHFMSFPLGTVTKLVGQSSMVGSFGNLYGSIQNLSDAYLQPNFNKDAMFNTKAPIHSFDAPPFMAAGDGSEIEKKYYACPGMDYNGRAVYEPRFCRWFSISDDPESVCPKCAHRIDSEVDYVASKKADSRRDDSGGFVQGFATYMVMDDLKVKVMPHYTISAITVLNEFNIKDIGSLEVKEVHFGLDEGWKVLKAALHSADSVLTTVFLGE